MNKTFTILIVALPILYIYWAPGIPVPIVIVAIIALYPIMILIMIKRNDYINDIFYFPLIIPLSYIIVHFFVLYTLHRSSCFVGFSIYAMLYVVFSLLTTIIFVKQFFDIRLAKKLLTYIAVFSSIYIIIQFALMILSGYYLPGTIPLLVTAIDEYETIASTYGSSIRLRSIFSEPAAYGTFISMYLIIDLFSNKKEQIKDYMPNLITSIGLILSRSTTAYLSGILVWCIWLTKILLNKSSKASKLKLIVALMICLPFLIFILMQTQSFAIFIEHTFGNNDGDWGIGVINRMDGNTRVFSFKKSMLETLFGIGMFKPGLFATGLAKLFLFFGIVGTAIWYGTYIYIFIKGNLVQRGLIVQIVLSSFFADSIFGPSCLIFFPYIITLGDEKTSHKYAAREFINEWKRGFT